MKGSSPCVFSRWGLKQRTRPRPNEPAAIERGAADLVAFGRPYMSNPDLVERFRHARPLADLPDMSLWWTPQGARGYVDFPAWSAGA
ncbi:MAG: hypothetical protein EBR86_13460 [Planctomycetia bacterium]|nr:hypothetical protein [Planctomycetia bacterium]